MQSNPNFAVLPSRYQSVSWRASSNSFCDFRNFSTLAQCVFEGWAVDMIACPLSSRRESQFQVGKIGLEIDFFHCPGVLDTVAKHIVEDRIAHGTKREAKTGVENILRRSMRRSTSRLS